MRALPSFGAPPLLPPVAPAARAHRTAFRLLSHDGYFRALCCCLAGYAIAGKGFAYVGVPPLLIGEVMLLLGAAIFVRTRCWLAAGSAPPALILALLMVWGTCRTVGFIGSEGLDAIRDSVIFLYGIFAFVMLGLLLEKPARIGWMIAAYGSFAVFYGVAAPVLVSLPLLIPNFPTWPGSGVPLILVRHGEVAIHLAGVATFVILGFRRVGYLWCAALVVSLVCITPSRGAMLSCLVPIAVAIVFGGQLKRIGKPLLAAFLLLLAAYGAGLEIKLPEGRSIGPQQIANNFESLLGRSKAANLDGTKEWRLRWWRTIETYTLHGPYFWTGKGFGVNLSIDDGFVVGQELGGPPLRSPHNIHYSLLARSGVPGLTLWVLLEVSWFAMMARAILLARRNGDAQWAKLLLWITCYGLAIIIDASFDVAIEGPMVGIWYWSVLGTGIATAMIYRARPSRVPVRRDPSAPNRTVRRVA